MGTRLTPMPAAASMTEMRMINLPMLPAPRPNGGAPHFHLMATAQRTRAQRPPPQTQRGNMHYGERVLNAGMLHYRVISAAKAHVHIGSITAATCCIPGPLDARSPAMETNGIATRMMPTVRHADHVVPSVHNVVRLTSLGMVRKSFSRDMRIVRIVRVVSKAFLLVMSVLRNGIGMGGDRRRRAASSS